MCVSNVYIFRMTKDSGFRIRVQRELREKFLKICREQDRPAAQVLREYMREFVAGGVGLEFPVCVDSYEFTESRCGFH